MAQFKRLFLSLLMILMVGSVALPLTATHAADAPLVNVSPSKEYGKILTGKDGLTLYIFTPDPLNDSVCVDKCATAWPPLTVASADKLTVADGIPGKFSTFARKDGTLQVAYNGQALYYWVKDTKAGDTTGHRVGRVWWVATAATVYAQPLPKLGHALVGPTGMTLYLFTKDTPNTSTCYDQCATAWPPLTVKSADELVPGINLVGKWGTAARKDGALQVTYNGWPLYYYNKDKAIGDATGENVGKVWFTVAPEIVGTANTKELGDFLTTPDGMTLYMFTKDAADTSNCSGDCAKAWPPYTVDEGERIAGGALKGKLGTIKRADTGKLQVTYNGMPLYLYATDKVPGDVTGQNVGKVWLVVAP
jgi:predicted lipoprotein with Yx(FWY)xxD motif